MVLPPRCPLCRVRIMEHGHLCGDCWSSLDLIAEPMCSRCGLPFIHEEDGLECGACLQSPPLYDKAFAPVLYGGKGRALVLALKHGRMFAAAPAMARLMVARISAIASADADGIIVPVPLHPSRYRARRFNQSQLLAQALSRETGLLLESRTLKRVRPTPSQGGLKRSGRFKNMRGAFQASGKQQLQGKTVYLIDDVLTTGATASACAAALKAGGAKTVYVVAFARVGEPIAG